MSLLNNSNNNSSNDHHDNNKIAEFCECVHDHINYNSVNITLYDNAKITLVNCELCELNNKKQQSWDDSVLCLCGCMLCVEHIEKHCKDENHSIVAYFNRVNDRFHCFKCSKTVQIFTKEIVDLNDLIDAFEMFYNTSLTPPVVARPLKERVVLDEVNVDGIVKYIQSRQCKNIVVLTGAGISVAAGIPDFRSPKTGLYNNIKQFNLPYPEAIFDIDYIKVHPEPFYVLAKGIFPGAFRPTPVHHFIKLLSDKDLLLRNYTQNIDTLERIAGVPESKLVEAHGAFTSAYCIACKHRYDIGLIKAHLDTDSIPYCVTDPCRGRSHLILPDIVFYGDPLPPIFNSSLLRDFPHQCDLLIVIGTSLKVNPIASMINFPQHIPRLLINNQQAGVVSPQTNNTTAEDIFITNGFKFNQPNNQYDVHMGGDCQDAIINLCEKLNWSNDLNKLMKR
ncbi:hypothetical protein CYY_005784 [Polysphondylium violaceum]|uniref:Deacetylase sirtuin-type domain-containing protein n=1 Tax=Polysphondylium violaceum TaxID=133409 RepID=A0A8J4PUH5_9MYCE|nr:hypothetical protein CYY_005784 [Polysphondylium violaceum]